MPSADSKHAEISRQIRGEIASGKYSAGVRLPSEAQLVKRFQVSRPTAAQALKTLAREGMVERRAGSGSYVTDSPTARRGVRQIGMIVPGLSRIEVFDVICGELASLARVEDVGILWGGSPRTASDHDMGSAEAEELCATFIAREVSGVVFAPFEHTAEKEVTNRRITERLRSAGIPVVLLDRDLVPFPHRSGFDLVGIDNFAGGYILAEHLIKLGAKRLAFFTRPLSATTVEGRKAGVCAAMLARGLTIARDFLHMGDPLNVSCVRRLTAGKTFDAVICTNDHTAAELLQTLSKLHISVPRQLRVVGFDDVRFATLLGVPLTTIHQPCREIAVTAFRAILERIEDPALPARSIALTPRLVVRESCGAYLTT